MASSGVVEGIWAVEEDREAASAIRDSASLSEMKDSEKMTSYCGLSVRYKPFGASLESSLEDMRANRQQR